jgi:hypothetical protein
MQQPHLGAAGAPRAAAFSLFYMCAGWRFFEKAGFLVSLESCTPPCFPPPTALETKQNKQKHS